MTQILVYMLWVLIFSVEFAAEKLFLLPKMSILVVEFVSLLLLGLSITYLIVRSKLYISPKYAFVIFFYFLLLLVSSVANSVTEWVAISMFRNYLKYLPLFVLPCTYLFSELEVRGQLRILFFLAVAQVPIAILQRFFLGNERTGDVVYGTLNISSILSIFLISTVFFVISFSACGYIEKKKATLVALLLFLPTTLNETKATLVFVVIGCLFFAIITSDARNLVKNIIKMVLVAVPLITVFGIVYDSLYNFENYQVDRTDPRYIKHYLFAGSSEIEITLRSKRKTVSFVGDSDITEELDEERIARLDSIIFPIKTLVRYPENFIYGLGPANASHSAIDELSGFHVYLREVGATRTTVSQMLWETGFLGLLLLFTFVFMVFKDSVYLYRNGVGIYKPIGLAWAIVCVLFPLVSVYKNMFIFNIITYGFMFWSGIVVSAVYSRRGLKA